MDKFGEIWENIFYRVKWKMENFDKKCEKL